MNNVKTGINFSTADNESKNGDLNVTIKVVVPTTTATFATTYPLQQQRLLQVMKRFQFLKHPHHLHLKWKI